MKRQIDTSIFILRQGTAPGRVGIPSAPEAITIATENLSGARAKKVRFTCYDGESRVPEYNQFDTFAFHRYKGPRGLSLTRIPRSTKRIAS